MSCPHSGPDDPSDSPVDPLQAGLISPRSAAGVCPRCFDFTVTPVGLCRNCGQGGDHVTTFVPIAYSIGGEWLHEQISTYKRRADPSVPAATGSLERLLRGFIASHEQCVAAAAGVARFDLVTTVPSGSARPARDNHHPLRELARAVPELESRYQRILYPGLHRGLERRYDPLRYFAFADLSGATVLLIDDLWTTGSSAQSAAAALRAAGARAVAVVTLGRHLNREWAANDLRLHALAGNFRPEVCALCAFGARVIAA